MENDWVFDIRQYLGRSLFGPAQSDRQVFQNVLSSPARKILLYPVKPRQYHLEDSNERVLVACGEYPDSLYPVFRVDPWQEKKALAECDQRLESGLFLALYLDPVEENFSLDHPVVGQLMKRLEKKGSRCILNAGFVPWSHPAQWAALARRHPGVRFLILNGGQVNISGLLLSQAEAAFLENPNTWLEFAGVYRNDFVEFLVEKGVGERICFGSGAPRHHRLFELERLQSLKLDPPVRDKIFRENALRFLGISPS